MATLYPWGRRIVSCRRLFRLRTSSVAHKFLVKNDGRSVSSDAGVTDYVPTPQNKPTKKAITISRSMRAYMETARQYNDMMKAEVADFEIGKRHLAKIMGQDPECFTQEDVNRAIEYLLPSGIFDKRSRPMLKDPYEIFPNRKAAQFGLDGRPYHWMYFTALPNYYNILYDIAWKLEDLKSVEDKLRLEEKLQEEIDLNKMILSSSEWISENRFSERLIENIKEKEYKHFLVLMERLASHPLAHNEEEYIMSFREEIAFQSQTLQPPEIELDDDGQSFSSAVGRRKKVSATVRLYKPGTGKFVINGKDLSYFSNLLYRESLIFPLSVANLIGEVDVVAEVEDDRGGPTGHAGAIRSGLAQALCAFVDSDVRENLRLTGMLTIDPRTRERKKPGQEKARKKFTWKKR